MKNKEIEELLNKLKDKDWYEELDLTGTKWIELKQEETNLLLSYIEQLEKRNESLLEDRKQLLNLVKQLENNKDKAIEICEFYNKKYEINPLGNQKVLFVINNVMNVLKGDSE